MKFKVWDTIYVNCTKDMELIGDMYKEILQLYAELDAARKNNDVAIRRINGLEKELTDVTKERDEAREEVSNIKSVCEVYEDDLKICHRIMADPKYKDKFNFPAP